MVSEYIYSGKEPLRETVVNGLKQKPKILERKSIVDRIIKKLLEFIEKLESNSKRFNVLFPARAAPLSDSFGRSNPMGSVFPTRVWPTKGLFLKLHDR